jgi:hypothetical protein
MFVKLKVQNLFTPYTFLTTDNVHTEYVVKKNNEIYGIRYFETNLDTDIFTNVIPKHILSNFTFQHMKINDRVGPHTDSHITCSINFYIKTNNCETVFYQKREHAKPVKSPSPYAGNGLDYQYSDIIPVNRFIASPYEVWLLNTSQIHSVEPLDDGPVYRDAIVLQTNRYSFEQLKTICKFYGSI